MNIDAATVLTYTRLRQERRARSRLATVHRAKPKKRRKYPYKTKALLGDDEWTKVTVISAPRTVAVMTRGRHHVGMKLVEVRVEGEDKPRRIAVERLQESDQ